MKFKTDVSAVYTRLHVLEDKYISARVGDEKRYYFNVGLAVVSNYLNNTYDLQSVQIDEYLVNSKFYKDIVRVLKLSNNADNLEDNIRVMLCRKMNALEKDFKEIRKLINKM